MLCEMGLPFPPKKMSHHSSFAVRPGAARVSHVFAALLFLTILFLGAGPVLAQTWDGGGADNNWSTAANWNPDAVFATGGSPSFSGTTRLTPFNDLTGLSVAVFNFASSAGAFVVSGNSVTLTGDSTNSATNKQTINLTLRLGGGSSRNFNVVNVAGETEISQPIEVISGTANMVKVGRGTLTFTAANTYNGLTNVQHGTLNLSGANGSLVLGTGTTVTNGATVRLTNTAAANNTARLADTQAISLTSGNFQFSHTGGAANYSETAGVLTIGGGVNSITSSQADSGQTSAMTFSSLTRTGGVLNFSGTGLGDDTRNRIVFTSAPNNDGIIAGYATVGNEFAKHDTGVGSVRAMQAGDYVTTDQDTWLAASNVKLTASPSRLTADRQINSLNLAPGGALTTDLGGRVLRVESGGILFSGTEAGELQHGTLTAGEGANTAGNIVIHQNSTATLTLGSRITNNGTGAVSVTKAGTGGLVMLEDNTYTGATLIYAGTLRTGVSGALSATSPLTLGDSSGTAAAFDTSGTSQAAGGLQVLGNTSAVHAITVTAGETLTVNGDVSIGANVASVTTNATMTGGGTLAINNVGGTFQLGLATGNISSNSATLDLTGLSTFTANMGTSSGVFRVGDVASTSGTGAAVLRLATNSTITSGRISVGADTGSATNETLALGAGSTVLNTNSLDVGAFNNTGARSFGVLNFATSNGTLTVRASDGVSATTMNVGYATLATTTGTPGGSFDSRGHSADLKLSTLNVAGRTGSGTGVATATFDFDNGILAATTVNLTQKQGSNTATGTITGTMTLAGGTINITTLNLASNATATGTALATLNLSGSNVATIGSIAMASATTAGGTATAVLNLNGGTLTMNGNITKVGGAGTSNATVTLNGATLDMNNNAIGTATNAVTLTAQAGVLKNVGSINGASGGLTKSGTGTLELQGSNSYGGATTVNAGTLKAATVSNGGAASLMGSSSNAAANVVLNGGTLQFTPVTTASTDRLFSVGTTAGSALDASGTAAVSFTNTGSMGFNGQTGTRTLTLTGTSTAENRLAVVIGDNGGSATSVTKTGAGTWLLTSANTYTGATTVNGGTLMLDFSAAGAPTVNIVSSSSTLALGGGVLEVRGTGGLPTQTFAGLAVNAGGSTVALTNGTVTFSGASISRSAGGTVNLATGPGAVFTASGSLNNAAGILGGYATYNGADFATRDGAGNLVAFSGYTALPASGGDVNTNYSLSTSLAPSGPLTVNSLKISGTGALALGTSTLTFTGTSGGLLYAPASAGDSSGITGTGVVGAGTTGEFIVHVNQGTLTIANPVVAAAQAAGSLTKAGEGTLVLTGTSQYTGLTSVNAGTLEISGTGYIYSMTGNIAVAAGATLRLNSTNAAQAIGDITDVAVAGTLEVRANETMGGLSGTGVVRNGGSTGSVMTVNSNNESSIYSGVIQNGATGTLGLTKGGNASNTSALTLAGAESNTYTGMTTVSSGTLILAKTGGAVAIGGDLTLGDGAGSAADMLQLNGSEQIIDTSIVTLTGNATVAGTGIFRLNGNTETIGGLSSAGTTQNGVVENALAATTGKLILNNSTDQSFTGVIQNGSGTGSVLALVKTGTGVQTLAGGTANTHTGGTTVLGGTLRLNKTAGVNALTGSITVGDGSASAVLLLVAGNQIADTSVVTLGGSGATAGVLRMNARVETIAGLSSSTAGSGVVENETGSASTATLTLNLAGNTTQIYSGILRDGDGVGTDGALIIVKSGDGVQVLAGDSTHSGGTTINAGTLVVGSGGATGSLGSGGIVNNGTLVVNRTGELAFTQAITGNGSVVMGGSGTVVLSGNSNTYSGGTIVDQGTLRVMNASGSATGIGMVTIGNGATLSGTGSVAGQTNINVGGMLSVGHNVSAGQTMTLSGGLFSAGILALDLWANAGGVNGNANADILTIGGGVVTLAGTLQLTNSGGISSWAVGDSWKLIDWGALGASDRTVAFDTLSLPNIGGSLAWDTSMLAQTGYITIVPEPGRMMLGLPGLAALGVRRRRTAAL